MATALGLDVDQNGNGTTPYDLQSIIGATYRTPGIVSGCAVAQQTTMAYKVFSGAVVIDWGADQKIIIPVNETVIPVDPNPGTTARRDKVYVQQRTVAADGDNLAVVAVTQGSLPPRSFLLADYEVPAGATSTKSAVDRANRVYTRQVGGQYGQVAKIIDTNTTPVTGKVRSKRGSANLFFGAMTNGVAPTDRDLMVHFTSCISAANGSPDTATGSVIYKFYLNDNLVATYERVFNKYWESKQFSFPLVIQQESNTIHYDVQWKSGYTDYQVRYGGVDSYPGDQLVVMDHGAANL